MFYLGVVKALSRINTTDGWSHEVSLCASFKGASPARFNLAEHKAGSTYSLSQVPLFLRRLPSRFYQIFLCCVRNAERKNSLHQHLTASGRVSSEGGVMQFSATINRVMLNTRVTITGAWHYLQLSSICDVENFFWIPRKLQRQRLIM
jgi:hypothetical protein